MALHDILVYVDESEGVAGTVAGACGLARRHDAHLTGQAVERPLAIPGFATVEIPPSAMEIIDQNRREAAYKWRKIFEAAVDAAGVTGKSGWAVARGEPVACLSLRSRYADLTVVSQTNPERRAGGDNPVDDLIVVNGRPILVIPYIGARPTSAAKY